MKKISIIDSKICNLNSLINALKHLGIKYQLINKSNQKIYNEGVILPGVGSFSNGMEHLKKNHMISVIKGCAKKKVPILGICLGMQLLFENSNEFGNHKGLDLIKGKVKRIIYPKTNVPIIGWYRIKTTKEKNCISKHNKKYMYFVHSYQAFPKNNNTVKATYKVNNKDIVAAVKDNNIYGYQFHPEKSSFDGLKMLKDFINI